MTSISRQQPCAPNLLRKSLRAAKGNNHVVPRANDQSWRHDPIQIRRTVKPEKHP